MKYVYALIFLMILSTVARSEETSCKMLSGKASAKKVLDTRNSTSYLGLQFAGMWISSSSTEGACILMTGNAWSKVLGATETSLGSLNSDNKTVIWVNYKGQVTIVDNNTIPEAGILLNLSCSK